VGALPILSAFLSPADAQAFLREYWPDRSFAAHGPLSRLPAAFRAPALSDAQTLTRQHQGRFTFGNAHAGSRTVNMDNTRPDLLLRMGLSLYLTEVLRVVPALGNVMKQLEAELGAPPGSARVGGFVAAAGNGVTCHFDSEEVFSVQLSGEKRWSIAKAEVDYPWTAQFNPGDAPQDDELYTFAAAGFPRPEAADWRTVDVKPGSVLFLPRGTWHRTEAGGESLSLSIMVRTPPAAETVLEALRLRMMQDAAWRKPLFGAWAEAHSAGGEWRTLLDRIPRFIDGLSLENALLPPLGELERLERLSRRSRLQARPEARMDFDDSGPVLRADVVVRDRWGAEQRSLQLEVPGEMAPLFRWLADSRVPFTPEESAARFPALALDQHLRVADALVRGRYLKQLWFDAPPPDSP
jgi:hypothetical protein